MSKNSDLVKNTIILGLGKLSTQFVSFLLLPIYTVFLAPEQFGTVDLITSYVTLLVPLIMIQMDRSAFRLLIDVRSDGSKARIVISNTLYIVCIALLIGAILYGIMNIFVEIPYALLILAIVIVTIFSNLLLQFARGFGKNTLYAVASIASGTTTLVLSLILVVTLSLGVEGVLWSMLVASLIVTIFLFFSLHLHRFISFASDTDSRVVRKELIEFGWPLVPSAASWWFIRTFDRTLVAIFSGVGSTGIYAVASRYSLILMAIYSIFDLSWTESASAHINSKDRDEFFSSVYNKSFRLFGAIGLMMISATPFLFSIIIGSNFQEAYSYIPILVAGALFNIAVAQYSVIYIAKKKTKQVLTTSLSAAVISVLLNFALIPVIGLYGAALSSAIAFFVMSIWRHFDVKKYVNITFTGSIFLKLSIMYAFVISVYYLNNVYLNILSLVTTAFAAFILNQEVIATGYKKAVKRINAMKSRGD